jgi:hypothetical protein
MTSSKEFLLSLRQIIREEVQLAIRSEFSKINLNESKQAKTSNPSTDTLLGAAQSANSRPKQAPVKKELKQYVKNPMLNEILNSVGPLRSEGPMAYLDESVDYNDQSEWPTMPKSHVANRIPATVTDIDGRRINTEALAQTESGQAVLNALTKDYSSLMKAIDKKQGR